MWYWFIGDGELDLINDADLPSVIYTIFKSLGFDDFTIRINNRKIIKWIIWKPRAKSLINWNLRIIDKIDKIGKEAVVAELEKIEVSNEAIDKIMNFIEIDGNSDEKIKKLKDLSLENETYKKGVKNIRLFGLPENNFKVDLTIARGLDYYTGTVYETFLNEYKEFEVCVLVVGMKI